MALVDNPGACPGDGWASLTQRGKNGKPGERGEKGAAGAQGRDGTGIDDLFIERGMLVVLLTDGRHKELPLERFGDSMSVRVLTRDTEALPDDLLIARQRTHARRSFRG